MRKLIFLFAVATATWSSAAERFRTDINPALLYHQGLLMVPQFAEADRKYLFETDWRNTVQDQRCNDLTASYRKVFKMLGRAAASQGNRPDRRP